VLISPKMTWMFEDVTSERMVAVIGMREIGEWMALSVVVIVSSFAYNCQKLEVRWAWGRGDGEESRYSKHKAGEEQGSNCRSHSTHHTQ
jgi:hypothetical protein